MHIERVKPFENAVLVPRYAKCFAKKKTAFKESIKMQEYKNGNCAIRKKETYET